MTSPEQEAARLRAVEAAVQAEVDEPGAVTKAELRTALATPAPPIEDPVTSNVERTV